MGKHPKAWCRCSMCGAEYKPRTVEDGCPYCRSAELEADAATFDKTVAVFGELQDAYNALEDGLRELAADWPDYRYPQTCADDVLALLGKEKGDEE